MPLASLSTETLVGEILRELDCAVLNFAGIADRLSGSRVAAALSGQNDFGKDDAAYYLNVARQMKRLQDEVGVPINWKRVDEIKTILGTRKRTAQRPVPFSVVFVGSRLLKNISAGQIETTDSYQECAAFKDFIVANAAAKLLDSMTNSHIRCTTISGETRNPDEFITKLTEIGFEQ
jgi:hypothetical protein